jgi:hypothetical protein
MAYYNQAQVAFLACTPLLLAVCEFSTLSAEKQLWKNYSNNTMIHEAGEEESLSILPIEQNFEVSYCD